MSDLAGSTSSTPKRNPLIWVAIVVIGLILYLLLGSERGNTVVKLASDSNPEVFDDVGLKQQALPGMGARALIDQARTDPAAASFDTLFNQALDYQREGSLADAHLLFFYCAREGYQPALLKMAELSDPTLFRAEDNLLDQADALQSYKWYQKLLELDQVAAQDRIENLHQWAIQASKNGDLSASQLLLVIQ